MSAAGGTTREPAPKTKRKRVRETSNVVTCAPCFATRASCNAQTA